MLLYPFPILPKEENKWKGGRGCSQSLTAQKHSQLLQLTTRDSRGTKYTMNKKQRWRRTPSPGWVWKSSAWSEVRGKSTHDKSSASSNSVSRIALHGKQGVCGDPWNVLWSFNGTRDFYLFIWYMVSDKLCTSDIVIGFFFSLVHSQATWYELQENL